MMCPINHKFEFENYYKSHLIRDSEIWEGFAIRNFLPTKETIEQKKIVIFQYRRMNLNESAVLRMGTCV